MRWRMKAELGISQAMVFQYTALKTSWKQAENNTEVQKTQNQEHIHAFTKSREQYYKLQYN